MIVGRYPVGGRRRLLVVHGHRIGNAVGGHTEISQECIGRVRRAERAARAERIEHVLFCGAGAPGHPSEARQMARLWEGLPIHMHLDERSTDSAENADQALRWARALDANELLVVSSWWHLRLLAYYRGRRFRGFAVRHARSWRWHRAVGHLLHELRYLPRLCRSRAFAGPAVTLAAQPRSGA